MKRKTSAKRERPTSAPYTAANWDLGRDGLLLEAHCRVDGCTRIERALTPGQLSIWMNQHEANAHGTVLSEPSAPVQPMPATVLPPDRARERTGRWREVVADI